MGLIVTEPSPSIETVNILTNTLTGWFNHTKGVLDSIQQYIWHNPYGLTPNEVINLLDSSGADWLLYRNKMIDIVGGGDITPDGLSINVDENGKLIIT